MNLYAQDLTDIYAEQDAALIGCNVLRGIYDGPFADDLEVSGYTPTLRCDTARLSSLTVAVGTVIDSVKTIDGRTLGPFTVRALRPDTDGAETVLQLEAT